MTQIGNVYGEALYELAVSESLDKVILDELNVLKDSFAQEPDFIKLLNSPSLPKQDRCKILDDSFRGQVQQYVLNFLKILTEKGYMNHFSHCCDSFIQHYNQDHNILSVSAVTSAAMTQTQKDALTEKLARITGKEILLNNRVDPACLGGIRLDFDGRQLDGTVSHRLDSVRDLLKKTVL